MSPKKKKPDRAAAAAAAAGGSGSTHLALDWLQWMDSSVAAKHELILASRTVAPQLHAILPIPRQKRKKENKQTNKDRSSTSTSRIINPSGNGWNAVASACLQVRAKDTLLDQRASFSRCRRCSTLCGSV